MLHGQHTGKACAGMTQSRSKVTCAHTALVAAAMLMAYVEVRTAAGQLSY